MKNFVLQNQTKILFGKNTIAQIGAETAVFGKNALLVYGMGSIRKHGIYDQVIESCKKSGLSVIEHGGVQSNPVLSHVRQGIDLAKGNAVEVIIAVGGGSVLDSAKAISAGAVVEHDVWKFFSGKKGIKKTLPLTCVLTLAASGSEMNGGMVVTNEETKQKFGTGNKNLNPCVSILDPTATFTVPPNYTAYGAIDAISHILEFYFTAEESYTPVQDRFMEGLVINLMDSCDRVLANLQDYNARADLMWCSTMALNGWTAVGLGKVGFPMHMIEHSISALFDVPHGAGLSVVVPAWMKTEYNKNPEKFAQFAERVFGIVSGTKLEKAAQGVERLENWFAKIKAPVTLAGLDISHDSIPELAENALDLAKLWRLSEYDKDRIAEILRKAV